MPDVAFPVVTVRGDAQLEGPPDLATCRFTVHRAGESQDRVRSALARASEQVRELLDGISPALESWSTAGLHVAPVFGRHSETRIRGYRGVFATEIVVKDFDALSGLVFALAPIPDSQIDGPWWSLRRDNPMMRAARLAAIEDARRRADDYAAAFGSTVTDLLEVSDLDGGFVGGREMRTAAYAMDSDAGEPAFSFEPTPQTVTGQVTVRFAIARPDLSGRSDS